MLLEWREKIILISYFLIVIPLFIPFLKRLALREGDNFDVLSVHSCHLEEPAFSPTITIYFLVHLEFTVGICVSSDIQWLWQ